MCLSPIIKRSLNAILDAFVNNLQSSYDKTNSIGPETWHISLLTMQLNRIWKIENRLYCPTQSCRVSCEPILETCLWIIDLSNFTSNLLI